jgi:uncharacterized protein (DUF983 family)
MPNFFRTPFDRRSPPGDEPQHWLPPTSGFEAALRGAFNRCPHCAQRKLFARYLKPVARCANCQQDWSHQRADDFPAYLAILIAGHVLAPIVIALISSGRVPLWLLAIIILSSAILLVALLLQPAKGAVIALQWWLGMHGFVRPRNEE